MELNKTVAFDGGEWQVIEIQFPYCLIQQNSVTKWVHNGVLDIPLVSAVRGVAACNEAITADEPKAKLYFVVFDGNIGGDWWACFDTDGNEYEGDNRLWRFRKVSLTNRLKRGKPANVNLPEVVENRAKWGSLYWYESNESHNLIEKAAS